LAGQLTAVHWKATYVTFGVNPAPQSVESDLMTGFGGVAARYTPFPAWSVTPMIELVMGAAFQEHGSNFGCHGGPTPMAQLGLGVSGPLAQAITFLAVASATGGFGGSECAVVDGPPATPLVGGGFGLHAGLAFDVGVGSPSYVVVASTRRAKLAP
jgi:hypothetical protein